MATLVFASLGPKRYIELCQSALETLLGLGVRKSLAQYGHETSRTLMSSA